MTKDGRPSRIKDIRLFKETWVKSDEHTALAFARRLAWWLNGEGFSIGHTPALYVYYSSDLPAGTVEAKPPRFTPDDWWFREVTVGVPPGVPGETAVEAAERGLVTVLKALKPEDAAMIDRAADIVTTAGDDCRFLLKVKETARQIIEVSTTIAVFREPSLFYVAVTDKATGAYREAAPEKLLFHDDAVALARNVKTARQAIEIVPGTSIGAQLTAARTPSTTTWSLDAFVDAERPVISGLLKFR